VKSGLRAAAIAVSLALLIGGEAAGQLAMPSARSQGLAGAFTARARGYEAAIWNPANLGLPDRPRWSFGLAGVTGTLTNNSLTYGQLSDLYGKFLDDAAKSELLAEVRTANPDGLLTLDFELGGSLLGFSLGRFGFGLGTSAAGKGDLSSEALELILFGNVGESGEGKDFDFSGSNGHTWWLSGGYLSYAQPFNISREDASPIDLSIGASFKYGAAHRYIRFDDVGTVIRSQPLGLDARAELLDSETKDVGRYWAFDVGVAAQWENLVAGLTLQNLVGDFVWNLGDFNLTRYAAIAEFGRAVTVDSTAAFYELSEEDRQRLEDFFDRLNLPTRLGIGAAYQVTSKVSLSLDYRDHLGGRLRSLWNRSLAVGGEFYWVRRLPLRAGVTTDFRQMALTAGAGLELGVFHADFAVGRWGAVNGEGATVALSVSFWPSKSASPTEQDHETGPPSP
jgi:hypothetical protein